MDAVQSNSQGGANLPLNKHMLPSTHRSWRPKRHVGRFNHFAQLTAECRHACQGMSFPLKIAPLHGGSGPHLIRFLGPHQVHNPNGILNGSAVFAQLTTESIVPNVLYNWPPAPKNAVSHGLPGPHVISLHGSLGPLESTTQTASRSIQPVLRVLLRISRRTIGRGAPCCVEVFLLSYGSDDVSTTYVCNSR